MNIQTNLMFLGDREIDTDLENVKKYAKLKYNAEVKQIGKDSWVVRPTGESKFSTKVFLSYTHMRAWLRANSSQGITA